MASSYQEYEEAWKKMLRIDVLHEELRKAGISGRYAEARRRRVAEELAIHERYLTPPARRRATMWQGRVFNAARNAQTSRSERGEALLSFWELVAHVRELPDLPGEETVVRYLNRIGYHGSTGRPKKS